MSGPDTILISLGGPVSCPAVGGKSSMISMGHFCPDTGFRLPVSALGLLDFALQQMGEGGNPDRCGVLELPVCRNPLF
jgi:hypothetical protein